MCAINFVVFKRQNGSLAPACLVRLNNDDHIEPSTLRGVLWQTTNEKLFDMAVMSTVLQEWKSLCIVYGTNCIYIINTLTTTGSLIYDSV